MFQLPNYSLIHQNRTGSKKGGGVCIFIHNSITYKTRSYLSINDENTESLCVELINKNSKNVLVCSIYPTGKIKPFKKYLKDAMCKNQRNNKPISGDFNLNILDYETNPKIKNFTNLLFQHNFIPLINRPTRITKRTATAIDNIITNSINNSKLTTGVVKTDLTDHFPIFLTSETTVDIYENTTSIFKRKHK